MFLKLIYMHIPRARSTKSPTELSDHTAENHANLNVTRAPRNVAIYTPSSVNYYTNHSEKITLIIRKRAKTLAPWHIRTGGESHDSQLAFGFQNYKKKRFHTGKHVMRSAPISPHVLARFSSSAIGALCLLVSWMRGYFWEKMPLMINSYDFNYWRSRWLRRILHGLIWLVYTLHKESSGATF